MVASPFRSKHSSMNRVLAIDMRSTICCAQLDTDSRATCDRSLPIQSRITQRWMRNRQNYVGSSPRRSFDTHMVQKPQLLPTFQIAEGKSEPRATRFSDLCHGDARPLRLGQRARSFATSPVADRKAILGPRSHAQERGRLRALATLFEDTRMPAKSGTSGRFSGLT